MNSIKTTFVRNKTTNLRHKTRGFLKTRKNPNLSHLFQLLILFEVINKAHIASCNSFVSFEIRFV